VVGSLGQEESASSHHTCVPPNSFSTHYTVHLLLPQTDQPDQFNPPVRIPEILRRLRWSGCAAPTRPQADQPDRGPARPRPVRSTRSPGPATSIRLLCLEGAAEYPGVPQGRAGTACMNERAVVRRVYAGEFHTSPRAWCAASSPTPGVRRVMVRRCRLPARCGIFSGVVGRSLPERPCAKRPPGRPEPTSPASGAPRRPSPSRPDDTQTGNSVLYLVPPLGDPACDIASGTRRASGGREGSWWSAGCLTADGQGEGRCLARHRWSVCQVVRPGSREGRSCGGQDRRAAAPLVNFKHPPRVVDRHNQIGVCA
jgi:hypothetical protein